MGRPALDTKTWVSLARRAHGDRYDYSSVHYTSYQCLVDIVCPEHGVFRQQENNHRNGSGCPRCGSASRGAKRRHSYETFVSAARQRHGERYAYPPQELGNNRSRAKIVCADHGEFSQMIMAHLAGHGCPLCRYEKRVVSNKLLPEEFLRRAVETHGGRYNYLENFRGMRAPIAISCAKHGVFSQLASNHLKGAGCPRCVGAVSKGEQELQDFVLSLCPTAVFNRRDIIKPFELDVYAPLSKVAIEYNGLWFHREAFAGNKSRVKWEACAEQGIKLVQIFEDEWRDNRVLVEGRIRALLGASTRRFARKCTLANVPPDEARAFVRAHHTQGSAGSAGQHQLAYGLYEGDTLVAVATFGVGRFKNSGWEMLRYCTDGRVVGGLSRLVTAFRREVPERLVSYADLRWGLGDSYAKAGFVLERITEPDYWWADTSKARRISRYTLQRVRGALPEKEYAARQGWHRILGVGHKKWVLEAPMS